MDSELLLSVIIPMYNAEKYIKRCIESCYKQGLKESEFEIIVVNDGSTDNSEEAVKTIQREHTNIVYYIEKNLGQGAARNLGIEKAVGKYVLFLDSDDYLLPNSVTYVLCEARNKSAEIARFLIDTELADGTIRKGNFDNKPIDKVITGEYALLHSDDIGSVCGGLYMRKFIISHGFKFITDIKHEDVAFEYSVYPYVKKLIYCDKHCYYYCYNSVSTDRSQNKKHKHLLTYSDMRIAQLLKRQSVEKSMHAPLRKYFRRTSNSILVSSFIKSMTEPYYTLSDFITDANELRLLPANYLARSWKSTLILLFINIIFLLKK